ncbi:coenzyme F420 hydrogenase subunit beta [Carboxydothermus ferrireducens DSM 11255]|uniref:Coenzyme F420 hydrogenase subunit beta n=2 Tax=Carboxydothermus TaxID=129957 RepID=A0ABX2RAC6_9THEO|nr:Coenzyme F420 hydrogenase/dehydrogenase, beta subunit C-terminal domain [Carboxydothermus ferrireducens]NYE58128.1 coenzyme F420 hydrogenase subunit beta [Carboxydothermus ferrireducens DSM 11255]
MTRVYGEPMPVCRDKCSECGICFRICPGSDVPLLELEKHFFGSNRNPTLTDLGFYRGSYVGYAGEEIIRIKGASGGVVTALLVHALEKGIIDCAIVAGFNKEKPWLTEAKLAKSKKEIIDAAQSKYAVVPVNMLFREAVKAGCQRVGIVGLPCHIHAVRKMQYYDIPRDIAGKIKLTIGLFCASQFYFEGTRHILVEWCGVDDMEEIANLEYRGGEWPGHFVVKLHSGETITIDRHRYVYHMLMPNYKRDRCEMCIDWSSELADIAVGDYWATPTIGDSFSGTSALLVRSLTGEELIKSAVEEKVLYLEVLEPEKLCSGVGFEMKKHGAAFRLAQRQQFGWPTPNYHMKVDYTPFFREFHMAPEKK